MSWSATAGSGFSTGQPFRSPAANLASHNLSAEQGDPAALLQTYRQLLALRRQSTAFSDGTYEAAAAVNGTLQFRRVDRVGAETVWVGLNVGTQAAALQIDGLAPATAQTPLWPATASAVQADQAGRATILLPARSLAVFRLVPATPP
jgi:glycosidase